VLFNFSAAHSFISYSCVGKLKLPMSSLNKDLVVETPTSSSVLTSNVCLSCPVEISGITFLIDLICLSLSQIDVILGMGWLSSNHVLLNCFDKTVVFDDSGVSKDMMYLCQPSCGIFKRRSSSVHDLVQLRNRDKGFHVWPLYCQRVS